MDINTSTTTSINDNCSRDKECIKRETSVSVSDLHSVSDKIKRLAISSNDSTATNTMIDGNSATPSSVATSTPLKTILSHTQDNFASKYGITKEIGRGGFSVVYECKNKATGLPYAVKDVDLRPLRLRERFNPSRLRREVDIMRKLNHPNIVKFIDAFETPDHLLMLMEYCPGDELFDVILARKYFTEGDARPIFAQICNALYYLHCLNIIHRDIKPENVLILHALDRNGYPIAKLLDFGLSKNAGGGSAAKTFVGTPCYLSPEVEYTSKGLGGTYGLPADCWSLGAVLYVMLVARFPEFEQDMHGKVVLKMPTALWGDVSSEAKDLIRQLMRTNPDARMTVGQALQHPWLSEFRVSTADLQSIAVKCYDIKQGLEEDVDMDVSPSPYSGNAIAIPSPNPPLASADVQSTSNAIVLYPNNASSAVSSAVSNNELLRLTPLLQLQISIATCFKEAHAAYKEIPEVASQVRKGATLCRQQLLESTKMLKKVEETSKQVLQVLIDLEDAIEDSEPQMARNLFNIIRIWVVELRELVSSTQDINKASMQEIQQLVEKTATGLQDRTNGNAQMKNKLITTLAESIITKGSSSSSDTVYTSEEVLELFLNLFTTNQALPSSFPDIDQEIETGIETIDSKDSATNDSAINIKGVVMIDSDCGEQMNVTSDNTTTTNDINHSNSSSSSSSSSSNSSSNSMGLTLTIPDRDEVMAQSISSRSPGSPAAVHLADALRNLEQVDSILEQLTLFWQNVEVILDTLTKKGQHVEQFIGVASKPRLLARFKERMTDYKKFWENVAVNCNHYISGVQLSGSLAGITSDSGSNSNALYTFLEHSSSGSSTNSSSDSGSNKSNLGLFHGFKVSV